eukprot:CAMPEP_0115765392 /NCGR_PEP_ID=MMETSP0272-20121206/102575_1 /TAXON_ID=71861 /ORGANISM="Scrippsiella trochoidea, Strain CCMP3099" /LENGTH=130 /DNA_ID=CAMNT_0003211255 /DNA_START=250 /DNA_END=642 /DNA_ORIENTATION=-
MIAMTLAAAVVAVCRVDADAQGALESALCAIGAGGIVEANQCAVLLAAGGILEEAHWECRGACGRVGGASLCIVALCSADLTTEALNARLHLVLLAWRLLVVAAEGAGAGGDGEGGAGPGLGPGAACTTG